MITKLLPLIVLLTITGCASTPEPTSSAPLFELSTDPLRVTLRQRRTSSIPGLPVSIQIRDITGGQTLCALLGADGEAIVHTRSMKVDDSVTLTLGEQTFFVTLVELRNFLASDDFAVFEISVNPPEPDEMDDPLEMEADTKLEEAEGDVGGLDDQ